MFYIEFTGIPGAGKSTLRKKMLASFNRGHNRFISSEEAFFVALKSKKNHLLTRAVLNILPSYIVKKHTQGMLNLYKYQHMLQGRFVARHIKIFDSLSFYLGNNAIPLGEKSLVISRLLTFFSFYQIIDEEFEHNIPVVFDSAFIQKSMSIFLSPNIQYGQAGASELKTYLAAIPLPKVIILVESSIEISIQRLKARPRGLTLRMAGLSEDELRSFLLNTHHHLNRMADMASAHGIHIIRISNNGPLSDAVFQLESEISKTLSEYEVVVQ